MKKEDVKITDNLKTKVLNVEISQEDFEFLKKNKLSITKIANLAIEELKKEKINK